MEAKVPGRQSGVHKGKCVSAGRTGLQKTDFLPGSGDRRKQEGGGHFQVSDPPEGNIQLNTRANTAQSIFWARMPVFHSCHQPSM